MSGNKQSTSRRYASGERVHQCAPQQLKYQHAQPQQCCPLAKCTLSREGRSGNRQRARNGASRKQVRWVNRVRGMLWRTSEAPATAVKSGWQRRTMSYRTQRRSAAPQKISTRQRCAAQAARQTLIRGATHNTGVIYAMRKSVEQAVRVRLAQNRQTTVASGTVLTLQQSVVLRHAGKHPCQTHWCGERSAPLRRKGR